MANAATFAVELAQVLADVRMARYISLRAIVAELTARGIRTRRGCRWSPEDVRRVIQLAIQNFQPKTVGRRRTVFAQLR